MLLSILAGRSQGAVTSYRGKVWVVGGCDAWNPLSSVEIYDSQTNAWSAGPPMGTPRRGCGLVEIEDLLYVIGGSDGTQSLCTTEVFDPRMNLWTAGPCLTTSRANVSATVVGDKIWVVGGFSGSYKKQLLLVGLVS
jgi:influenza virus NS1A-binding protein